MISLGGNRIVEFRKQKNGCQVLGREGNEELVFNGFRVSAGEDEKVPEMNGGDGCTAL